MKVAMQTVGKWSKDYIIGLRKFSSRPSVDLPLWTGAYNWAKANIPAKVVKEDNLSMTVEVQAQVVQSKKRVAKDAAVISESSSVTINSCKVAKHRKIDEVAVSDSLSQSSTNEAGASCEPISQSKKRGNQRKKAQTVSEPLSQSSANEAGASCEPLSQSKKRGNQRKKAQALSEPLSQLSANEAGASCEPLSQSKKRGNQRKKAEAVSEPLYQSSANEAGASCESTLQLSANPADVVPLSQNNHSHNVDNENFEIFKRSFHKWTVTIVKNDNTLYESKCNCPVFLMEYICKHVVGLAIRLKLVSVPIEAKTVPIGQKRKRGRPSKTKPALMLQ